MKQLVFFICLLSGFSTLYGQKSIETVVSSSSVTVNQRFNFEIVINSRECEVSRPDFGDLEIVGGPSQSQYNSTQIINGVRSQKTEFRWTYQLRAKKEGSYTIPGVSMSCGSEVYTSEPVTVSVSKGTETSANGDYFMRLTSNKGSVYEGEPFVVTLKYYAKARPESFQALDLGDAVGIYRQDLNPDRNSFQTNGETINGVRYYTIELREELCFAQRSGTVTLSPYYASLIFQRDFFSRFQRETYSNSLDVAVKKIPGSDRPDFNGLVGDFSVSSEISNTHVKMGDAIDIKITVEGTGNMQDLGDIKLDIPAEFDQFDPEIEDKTTISRQGFGGKIEYNFVIIPKHYGNYTIPGYAFSYFDLESKKMKSVSTEDFVLTVDKREGVDIVKPDVPTEETDIHYIDDGETELFTQEDFVFGTWTHLVLVFSPIVAALFLVFIRRRKENLSDEDLLKLQQKKAIKLAQTGLKEVQNKLTAGEDKEALKGMQQVLNQFFMQKFNVGLSDLSQRSIDKRLSDRGVDEDTRNAFNKIWNKIEMGQYAPIPHDNLVQTVSDTETLIIALDKKI